MPERGASGRIERFASIPTAAAADRHPPRKGEGKMLALFLRDLRLGIRAGGGALTGVLFFLAVVATIPFARRARPQPARPHRPGDPVDRRAARLAARPRPAVPGRPRGRLARPAGAVGRPPHAGADGAREMPGALDGERAAAGDRRAAARAVHQHRAGRHRRGRADAARRHAGHHLHRRGGCGGRGRRCRAAGCWCRCWSCRWPSRC